MKKMSFFFKISKCYLSFNPYYENTTELDKQYCPMEGYQPVNSIQLGMCTLHHNTTFRVTFMCLHVFMV